MEEFIQQLIASGPTGIICAALVYVIISLQRNKTTERRDNETEALNTRISVLENEVQRFKNLDLETKLAQIQTDLQWIKENLKK